MLCPSAKIRFLYQTNLRLTSINVIHWPCRVLQQKLLESSSEMIKVSLFGVSPDSTILIHALFALRLCKVCMYLIIPFNSLLRLSNTKPTTQISRGNQQWNHITHLAGIWISIQPLNYLPKRFKLRASERAPLPISLHNLPLIASMSWVWWESSHVWPIVS